MRGAWFLAAIALFATTETGCKVKERTAVSTASKVETASEAHRDSIRVVTRDQIIYRIDTLTVREVVREYGAPIRTPDGDYFVPIVREITRGTETGTKETWQAREDILSGGFEEGTFSRESNFSAEEHTTHATDDKSGWYLTLTLLGALALILYFLGKRIDKYL